MEKLFTVEDIAKMASMTTRTIRNYLKDGILEGRKIGGQWRFTEEDIKKFMDSGNVTKDFTDRIKQDVLDFIEGVNTDYTGEIQVCAIIDLYQEKGVIEQKRDKIVSFINSEKDNELVPAYMRYLYEYIENEQKGRITLFAPPKYISEALKLLG
ncbi:MAG: helix-turn-helix domain-containing protein [Oscillospiraceae bacterium]|nr:helix-turn-helix domain-containing protein [Oscillospiraceae bacterium]